MSLLNSKAVFTEGDLPQVPGLKGIDIARSHYYTRSFLIARQVEYLRQIGETPDSVGNGAEMEVELRNDYHINPVFKSNPGWELNFLPGCDISKVVVKRNESGEVIYDAPNYGFSGFGGKLETPLGDAWQYDRYGHINPLYAQAFRAAHEIYIKPEHLKKWVGINPDYDHGISFDAVYPHWPNGTTLSSRTGRNMLLDAPDTGVSGPQYQHPRHTEKKLVYKFDNKGELNPLFVQIRRSIVKWE
jgi:hypothetical protein